MGRAAQRKAQRRAAQPAPIYDDYPFEEIALAAEELIAQGHVVFIKWTCEGCGRRVAFDQPNVICRFGKCDECGHVTNVERRGGNYLVMFQSLPAAQAFLSRSA
jgi:hypothetical protein